MKTWLKNWPQNLPYELVYPSISIDKIFEKSAEFYPDKAFMIFYDKIVTYSEAWNSIMGIAGTLQKLGIKKGDRIGIYMQNSPNFVISYFGIIKAGGIVVLMNPMLKREEIKYILDDSKISAVITTGELLNNLLEFQKTHKIKLIAGNLKEYIPDNTDIPVPAEINKIYELFDAYTWAEAIKNKENYSEVENSADDIAMIAYTSGTTAIPKGCVHKNRSIIANAMDSAYWRGVTSGTVELSVAPFFHVTGLSFSVLGPIYEGATMVTLARWNRIAAIKAIEKYKVTHWVSVPTMIADLLAYPDLDKIDLSSLRFIGGGGAAMPKPLLERFENLTKLPFVEGYGMTEMMGQTHINPPHKRKSGSIGIPQFGVDAKIIDWQTGKELGFNEIGEIVFKGPSQFSGYYNKSEETEEAFIEIGVEKFLRSGDIGFMDDEGYFYVVDRLKRMINRGGFKVWPLEVENVLYSHKAIKECCVISTKDERVGEEVKALVVLKDEYKGKVSEGELIQYCKERLADYKYPRIIEFVDEILKTGSGKIDWRKMQEIENKKYHEK
ncbi:MAG: long-chain-fatty-acid--CoA ligase [Thermoplasmata archaeon]